MQWQFLPSQVDGTFQAITWADSNPGNLSSQIKLQDQFSIYPCAHVQIKIAFYPKENAI